VRLLLLLCVGYALAALVNDNTRLASLEKKSWRALKGRTTLCHFIKKLALAHNQGLLLLFYSLMLRVVIKEANRILRPLISTAAASLDIDQSTNSQAARTRNQNFCP
jgi:hypothetical protein